jgi:hypothetical protein
VNNGVGTLGYDQLREEVVVLGEVEILKADCLARNFLPNANALAHRANWRQGVDLELKIDGAAAQVVNDDDVVANVRKVQGGRPTTKSITTKN